MPFPFTDRLAEKRRPALVVSDARLAAEGMVWLAMITSAQHSANAYDCKIADLNAAGLPNSCVVRPIKITAVEPGRIVRRAGRLGARELEQVLELVRSFVGPLVPRSEPPVISGPKVRKL